MNVQNVVCAGETSGSWVNGGELRAIIFLDADVWIHMDMTIDLLMRSVQWVAHCHWDEQEDCFLKMKPLAQSRRFTCPSDILPISLLSIIFIFSFYRPPSYSNYSHLAFIWQSYSYTFHLSTLSISWTEGFIHVRFHIRGDGAGMHLDFIAAQLSPLVWAKIGIWWALKADMETA